MKLLREWSPFEYSSDMIVESKEANGGKIIMKGVLQKSDTLNQNKRIYPQAILEREIRNYQKFIAENRALGECDHPQTSVVELKNASHIIREAHMEGGVVYGTVELLDTPAGKILQSLVESGVTLGISSRGVGSTKRDGDYDIVQDDFQLICWDFVSEPSTPGAFMMAEGKNVSSEDLNRHFNKTDKIDRVFNEILDWEK
tara:strand:- start:299 stop:898 length:600 start_codon:yes stop_codon:yes gene_type:complete